MAYLGGELGKLLEVEIRVLLVLLSVYDHGLVLVRKLARDARVFVRLIRASGWAGVHAEPMPRESKKDKIWRDHAYLCFLRSDG